MPADGVTHIDTGIVQRLGDSLSKHASDIGQGAGGVNLAVPPIPEDSFGLRRLIVEMDRAREAFDQRLATALDGAGERALLQVFDATEADARLPYLPLPESAR